MTRRRILPVALLAAGLLALAGQASFDWFGDAAVAGTPNVDHQIQRVGTVRMGDLPPRQSDETGRISIPRRSLDPSSGSDQPDSDVAVAAPTLNSAVPVPLVNFQGLTNNDNANVTGFTFDPPDTQGAVGPNHVCSFSNNVGRCWDKTGTPAVGVFDLEPFFLVDTANGFAGFDPVIDYDDRSDRWFGLFASEDGDTGVIHVAVSGAANPLQPWTIYNVTFEDVFLDYPHLGISNEMIIVTVNDFTFGDDTYTGAEVWAFDKDDLVALLPGNQVNASFFGPFTNIFTIQPAHQLSSSLKHYMAGFAPNNQGNKMRVYKVTGEPSANNVAITFKDLTVNSFSFPPTAHQPGAGSPRLDSGDQRALDAVWRGNRLWVVADHRCKPHPQDAIRSCMHLVEVNTAGNDEVVRQDFFFGMRDFHILYPGLTISANGTLYVAFSRSGAGATSLTAPGNPSAWYTARESSDPLNTLQGPRQLFRGRGPHIFADNGDPERWGDYQAAAVDPSDTNAVWVFSEYQLGTGASAGRWAIRVAKVKLP
ncbi:MAG: hypothetical protein WEB00_14900 [Dehalococcoidia bacterium]